MEIKIIRRTDQTKCEVGPAAFYPKNLHAIERYYAPNRAFRLTREELKELLAALQAEVEYRDGIVALIDSSSGA